MGRLSNETVCIVRDRRNAVTICGLPVRTTTRVETVASWPDRQRAEPAAVLHRKCAQRAELAAVVRDYAGAARRR
jgi:hypothetical protein